MSYYDFYRPESYRPTADVYLKKTSAVNDDIDTLRHATTQSLLSRRDVVVVASVSCLYGLGVPDEYRNAVTTLRVGEAYNLADLEATLASLRYEAGGARRGTYAVQYLADGGAELTLMPVGDKRPVRLDFGPHDAALDVASDTAFHGTGTVSRAERRELRGVWRMPPPRGAEPPAAGEDGDDAAALAVLAEAEEAEEEAMAPEALEDFALFPASHHITSASERERVVRAVMSELKVRAAELRADGRVEIAERLEQRTRDDMRDFAKAGYCSGLENYSRHLAGRKQGQPPLTLLDYFPPDQWNLLVDESHVSLPQLKAMHAADQRRKHSLVAHGFRLPSALDNRPLTHGEFWERVPSAVLVSATPGKAERALCAADDEFCAADDASPRLAEMVLRPTGITDPTIVVRPRGPQLDDVLEQAAARAARGERTLVTALTKVAAERLATHFEDRGLRASYMHSDTTSLDRMRILKKLRQGELQVLVGVNLLRNSCSQPAQFHSQPAQSPSQVLVGVNLLREGLDLPEVSSPCSMQIRRGSSARRRRCCR